MLNYLIMKNLKHLALGIIGAIFLTASLFACSNDEVNKTVQENVNMHLSAKTNENIKPTAIGLIESEIAVTLFNKEILTKKLISGDLFVEIESIDLDYGFDSENDEHVAYLTIIGKNSNDFSLEAFQAKLVKEGDLLIIQDPIAQPTLFAKHSCAGSPCTSCSFTRTGFLNLKITGCACNQDKEGATCNHSINGGTTTLEIVKTVVDTAL